MKLTKLLTLIFSAVSAGFVIWLFVRSFPSNVIKSPKFFTSQGTEFVVASVDYENKQIALLGEYIPYQVVDFQGNQDAFLFTFQTVDPNVKSDGHYSNRIISLLQNGVILELSSSSPKNLMSAVSNLYKQQQSQKAFELK